VTLLGEREQKFKLVYQEDPTIFSVTNTTVLRRYGAKVSARYVLRVATPILISYHAISIAFPAWDGIIDVRHHLHFSSVCSLRVAQTVKFQGNSLKELYEITCNLVT